MNKYILITAIATIFSFSTAAQNLTIDETLDYLTDLCCQNGARKEYSFTTDGPRIKKVTHISSSDGSEKFRKYRTVEQYDIRFISEPDPAIVPTYRTWVGGGTGIRYHGVSFILEKGQCRTDWDYFLTGESAITYDEYVGGMFMNEDAARKFIKAMLYLKKKMIEQHPIKPDPFE